MKGAPLLCRRGWKKDVKYSEMQQAPRVTISTGVCDTVMQHGDSASLGSAHTLISPHALHSKINQKFKGEAECGISLWGLT